MPFTVAAFCACGTQAALSCVKAKGKLYAGDGEVDWSAISLETYLEYVDQILPQVDEDTDKLDDEEQMANAKERRNLTDIFLEKRRVVNGVKIRTLLKVSLCRKRVIRCSYPKCHA